MNLTIEIINAACDFAIVQQEVRRAMPSEFEHARGSRCIPVHPEDSRWFSTIGQIPSPKHQMVQRRVQQHDANVPTPPQRLGKGRTVVSRRNDDDRGSGTAQDSRLLVGDAAEGRATGCRGTIMASGLRARCLRARQACPATGSISSQAG